MKMFILFLPVSAVITWTLAMLQRNRVLSEIETSSVTFGRPLGWITQDQSRFQWAHYPQDLRLTFIKFDQLPTSVNWVMFGANVLIITILLMVLYYGLPHIMRWLKSMRGAS